MNLKALGLCFFFAANAMAAAPPAGRLEWALVPAKSLAGNLSGDPAEREALIYTPPGYATDTQRRYPVVYFLHGFRTTAQYYANTLGGPTAIDRAISEGKLQEMIVVIPDAYTPYGGSMFSNSATTGNWEAFIARDLVKYVDSHYRTIAKRESRGLTGHSMGGYGTLRIGMKYPDTFVALYAMSSCCLDPRAVSPADAAYEKVVTAEDLARVPVLERTLLAASAAWASNAKRPPLYIDLPTANGVVRADIVAKYKANALTEMVPKFARQLKRYKAIAMDIGLQDRLIAGNEATHQALIKAGVEHSYETYVGDHSDKVPERFEKLVLPFFSKELAGSK